MLRDSLDPPVSPIFEALLCRVTPLLCHMRRVVNFLDGSAFYLLGCCDNFQASYMLDWEPDTRFCVYQLEYFAKKSFLLPPVLSQIPLWTHSLGIFYSYGINCFFSALLFSGIECPKFTLCFPCLRPGVSHLFKNLWFLLVEIFGINVCSIWLHALFDKLFICYPYSILVPA